ncbi:MAG TPA: hypothetical protein V6C64_13680 [Microcoleaceae cyanobacterium]
MYLPFALKHKYPNVDRQWIQQSMFSADRSVVWRDRLQLGTI